MRDLVQKLPSGNPQRDVGTSDDTIAAVLATLNEVIKKHPEFSRFVESEHEHEHDQLVCYSAVVIKISNYSKLQIFIFVLKFHFAFLVEQILVEMFDWFKLPRVVACAWFWSSWTNLFLQVSPGGWRGGQVDERDQAAGQVHQQGGQVRQPGLVQHVAAPGAEGGLQEVRLEGGRLCDQDSGSKERQA